MKLHVVAIFDSAIQSFSRPFFVPHRGAAVRSFVDEVNRDAPDNQFHNHRSDFELRAIAMFDDEYGTFEQVPHETLIRGKDISRDAPQ